MDTSATFPLAAGRYPFGKDFTFQVNLIQPDGTYHSPDATAPAIYVCSARPDRTAVIAGTPGSQVGSTITSWTTNNGGSDVTIPAISDPAPSSSVPAVEYWIACKFKLQSSIQDQVVITSILMERVRSQTARADPTIDDVKAAFPSITAFTKEAKLVAFVTDAIEDLKTDLEAAGIAFASVMNLTRLRRAIAFKAIALASEASSTESDDAFERRAASFNARYEKILKSIHLPIDVDGDGTADTNEPAKQTFTIAIR